MRIGDRHFGARDANGDSQAVVVLECPSCKRTGTAKVLPQARDRPVTVRVTDGFTVLLNSTLEVKCGKCEATVYAHREWTISGDACRYDELGHPTDAK